MFTHVFDEMKRRFFDEAYVRLDRLTAYECYEKAVEAMTRIVTGRRIEYADKEWGEVAVVAMTRFDLSCTIEWANEFTTRALRKNLSRRSRRRPPR